MPQQRTYDRRGPQQATAETSRRPGAELSHLDAGRPGGSRTLAWLVALAVSLAVWVAIVFDLVRLLG